MVNFKELKHPYLIAEVGINHNGDLQIAKKLIDATFACRWDCVKFQKKDPDTSVPERQKHITKDTPWGRMTYLEYKKRMEFSQDKYDYIEKYCKEKPIDWTASVWDLPSLGIILKYDVPFIKIPSAKLTDSVLLTAAAKSKKTLVVSTGMSTLQNIDNAVDILKRYATNFVLMHANSSYPTPYEELNLNCIKTLKKRYNCVVGYSGHEYSLETTVYACVLGAKVIERHITLSHQMWGTDHRASIEVAAMDLLRNRVKDIDAVLGDGEKKITASERKIKAKLKNDTRSRAGQEITN